MHARPTVCFECLAGGICLEMHASPTCVVACAGSTPFHSSGSRQRMADFSDDSDDADISESGSPTTVSRRLLEPVLMETIRNMNAFKPSNNKASTCTIHLLFIRL